MAIKFKTLCAIGALLLCSNNALAMPDNSRNSSSRNNMANVSSSNNIKLLYDYCQHKGINLSNLNFKYEINKEGYWNCKVTINGETYDENLGHKSKKGAKNEIAGYVYDELVKRDGYPQATKRKNNIELLYDYCRDENTKINLSDLSFDYETNKEGYWNCKVTINGETYDENLGHKSQKGAKNEIVGYVYDELVKRDGYPQATNLNLDDSDSESSSDDNSSNALDQTASSDDSDSGSSSDDSSNI